MRLILGIGLGCMLIPASARAQSTDCPAVAARVSAGTSAVDDLVLVMQCPAERATALASWVTVRQTETDTALLLTAYWGVNRVRAPQTFEAVMNIAPDTSASVESRVLSTIMASRLALPMPGR